MLRAMAISFTVLLGACDADHDLGIACDQLGSPQYADELYGYEAWPEGYPVPATFDLALEALDHQLTTVQKSGVRCAGANVAIVSHFGLGLWIRNEWGLYESPPLAKDMAARGFITPDDMSAAIVDSYARKLRGEAFNLEQRAASVRAFWTKQGVDFEGMRAKLNQ